MNDVNDTNDDAVQAIRDLVAERVRAVKAKDPEPLAHQQADDIITFDVLPPLRSHGVDAVAAKTQSWFDGYDGDIDYDVRELAVTAAGELGFCSYVYHVGGTLVSGNAVDMWARATLCCRRIDGTWRIVHDHESVPFDPETGQAQIGLQPE